MADQGKFHIITLGCKVNQYESESIRESWQAKGLVQTHDMRDADVILINSCAITAKAVSDVRYAIRQAHRTAPEAKIILTGCAAKLEEESFGKFPGLESIIPQEEKNILLSFPFLERAASAENDGAGYSTNFAGTLANVSLQIEQPTRTAPVPMKFQPFSITSYERSRAVVKVQDGCSHRCTYCIVPLTRGAACSREPEAVVAELEHLLAAGFREIGISGVNLRQYGNDLAEKIDFWDLLLLIEARLASKWSGIARLRLSSLEPGQLGSKALDVFCASGLLAPHLHLSLQSGSRSVLKRMGRGHYTPDMALDFTRKLQQHWPLLGLGADILTAFPGETAEEFSETMDFCRQIGLTYAHVFPYSRRPKTVAASMPEQISPEIKKERAKLLRNQADTLKQLFIERLVLQSEHIVVAEQNSDKKMLGGKKIMAGVNAQYADCEILADAYIEPGHTLLRAKAVKALRGRLQVELL